MASPIQVQQTSNSASSSNVQSWSYSLNSPINYSIGSSPTPFVLNVQPIDYATAPQWQGYSDFKIEIDIIGTGITCFKFTNGTISFFIPPGFSNFDLNIIPSNTGVITPGTYIKKIKFNVLATAPSGQTELLETKYKQLTLIASLNPDLEVSDTELNLNVLKNSTGSNGIQFNINCNTSWQIANSSSALEFVNLSGVENQSNAVYFKQTHTHSATGVFVHSFTVQSGGIQKIVNVNLKVLYQQQQISPNPLLIYQNLGSPLPNGLLNVLAIGSGSVTAPAWLTIPQTNNNSGPLYWSVNNSVALNYGENTGNITIGTSNGTLTIPVILLVSNFVDSSNFNGDYHFTRDNKILYFNQSIPNSIVKLKLEIKFYDWQGVEQTESILVERAFFKSKTSFNLGKFIEAFFINPENYSNINTAAAVFLTPKFTEVNVFVQEMSNTSVNPLQQVSLLNYKFIKGNKSLNLNNPSSYVIENGRLTFNKMIHQNESWSLKLHNQSVYSGTTNFTSLPRVICFSFKLPAQISTGSEITLNIGSSTYQFLNLPSTRENTTVFYQNEHNLPESLTFKGSLIFDTDFNFSFQKKQTDFLTTHQSLALVETEVISVNVMSLPVAEIFKLKQLLRNNLIFVNYKDKWIKASLMQNKLTVKNQSGVINYTFKIKVSRKDYDKIYT